MVLGKCLLTLVFHNFHGLRLKKEKSPLILFFFYFISCLKRYVLTPTERDYIVIFTSLIVVLAIWSKYRMCCGYEGKILAKNPCIFTVYWLFRGLFKFPHKELNAVWKVIHHISSVHWNTGKWFIVTERLVQA